MILKEIGPFRTDVNGYDWDYRHLRLCSCAVGELFDVDEDRPLWVRIHDSPAKDRLHCVVGVDEYGDWELSLETRDGDMIPECILDPAENYIKRHLPKSFYVEIVQ